MAEIGSGDYKARQAKQSAEAAKQAEAGLATQGLKLRCDVNGCVIVPINAQHSSPGLAGRMASNCDFLCIAEHLPSNTHQPPDGRTYTPDVALGYGSISRCCFWSEPLEMKSILHTLIETYERAWAKLRQTVLRSWQVHQ